MTAPLDEIDTEIVRLTARGHVRTVCCGATGVAQGDVPVAGLEQAFADHPRTCFQALADDWPTPPR